jgi:outer membrane protein TolC
VNVKKSHWALACFAVVTCASSPAAPQEADLALLLREALGASPALRAAEARLEAARHLPSQAEAPPDPEVSLAYLNDGLSSFTLGDTVFSNLALTWTQEVPYPGKLRRSAVAAQARVEIAGRELERLRLEVGAAVKAGYADLYRLDRTAALLEETQSVLESLAQAARSRYEVGQGIQENVLKAMTEIVRLEAEQVRVAQDRVAAEARLNAVLGRSTGAPIGAALRLPEGSLPDGVDNLAEAAAGASPEILALEAAVRGAQAKEERARLDLKPDFIWSASYQYRGDIDPMVMGMFGLRLPIYRERKQAEALLQAGSEVIAARHALQDLQVRTRASVRELVARAERARRLMVLYEQGIIPQAGGALDAAQASYGVGRIPFLDLLNDLTILVNARIELAAQQSDRLQALAALEPLVSRELVIVPGATGGQGGSSESLQ